jgi:hypothetical protein
VKKRKIEKRQSRARQRRFRISREMLAERKRRIQERLKHKAEEIDRPMFRAANIQYEVAERTQAVSYGGMGLIHTLATQSGLITAIDRRVEVLEAHFPYHESDHVLNIAYNALTDGRCLEDIELKRNDEAYLNALGTTRIPDPTTAGDFCRRFTTAEQIGSLQRAIDEARLTVWARQPQEFFEQATVDMDGHIVETSAECKHGIDISYDGRWSYHPLLVSLAETGEPLRIVNRPGNRPSHEGAAAQCDEVITLLRTAGFRRILLRGDTDYSQTEHLDRWHNDGIVFHFGYDARKNLVNLAGNLPETQWKRLQRPPRYSVKTQPRAKPERVKEQIVIEREFTNIVLESEDVAEFDYRPTACSKAYRMVVVRKNLSVEKGENVLFDDIRYFFYSNSRRVWFLAGFGSESVVAWLRQGRSTRRRRVSSICSGRVPPSEPWNDGFQGNSSRLASVTRPGAHTVSAVLEKSGRRRAGRSVSAGTEPGDVTRRSTSPCRKYEAAGERPQAASPSVNLRSRHAPGQVEQHHLVQMTHAGESKVVEV